jgi:hypothetical protein
LLQVRAAGQISCGRLRRDEALNRTYKQTIGCSDKEYQHTGLADLPLVSGSAPGCIALDSMLHASIRELSVDQPQRDTPAARTSPA